MRVIKRLWVFGIFFWSFFIGGTIHAQYADYNRPNPLMDYVPQEIGIYDTIYDELTETDCRRCHGNSLADRHHATDTVIYDRLCTPCHDIVSEAPGVVVTRDCMTVGCHSTQDLSTNGWHHNTDLSGSGNCVACHDPNLVARISPVRDFNAYPPSIVTPTPFSCENCHWEQKASVTGNPEVPGHPSTYDHTDASYGVFVGFHEYGKAIYGSFETHHMGFRGNAAAACYQCHAADPNKPSWSADDPELIRYCQTCHDVASLHRIAPHVAGASGWSATGFHVDGDSPLDMDPDVYRTSDPTGPYQPEIGFGFTADEMCMGCHGDAIPTQTPPSPSGVPVIDSIAPAHGVCGALVVLGGAHFGEEHRQGHYVEFETTSGQWAALPIYSWTSTQIEFQVPCWEIGPGNYKIRVVTPQGPTNQVNFTVENVSVRSISPEAGSCGTWVGLQGFGFGNGQAEMLDGYYGVHRVVDFVSSQGAFTALSYEAWTDTSLQVKFGTFFQDRAGDDDHARNFIHDADEPLISGCGIMGLGRWSVYLQTIYFGDDDGSGGLTRGDTIYQVIPSHPYYFEFAVAPKIHLLSPDNIHNGDLMKMFGANFGPSQGSGTVRIGSEDEAQSAALGKGLLLGYVSVWSNTLIKVHVDVPPYAWGATWFVWVEKAGFKSNYKPFQIHPGIHRYTLTTLVEGQGSVTADPGGGTYAEGASVALTAVPASGWQFSHWTNGVQTSASNPLTVTMSQDRTFMAVFTEVPVVEYTLTTLVEGQGSVTADPEGGTYAEGASVALTAVPASGWRFSHWTNGVQTSASNPLTVTMSQDRTFRAVFTQCSLAEFRLTLVKDGEGSIIANPPCGTYFEGSQVELTAVPASGWRFSHWTNGVQTSQANPLTVMMSQDRTVKAVFTEMVSQESPLMETLSDDEEDSMGDGFDPLDGADDGGVDSLEKNTASFWVSDGQHYVTIESAPGTILSHAAANSLPPGANSSPPEEEYPYGFFAFTVENVEVGGETTVTIYLPADAAPSKYYKYGPEPENIEPHWYEFMYDDATKTGAVIEGNMITLYFVDGARGDDDLEANGRIVDDGGPSSKPAKAKGGCFIGAIW